MSTPSHAATSFRTITSIELDAAARETLKLNRPQWGLLETGNIIDVAKQLQTADETPRAVRPRQGLPLKSLRGGRFIGIGLDQERKGQGAVLWKARTKFARVRDDFASIESSVKIVDLRYLIKCAQSR